MSTSNGHATGKTVSWDKQKVKRFKEVIRHVQESRESQFEFDGSEYDLKYAKYLLEYLEGHFK
jgi:hypothetical protein